MAGLLFLILAAGAPAPVPAAAPARVQVIASAEVLRPGSNDPRGAPDAPAQRISRQPDGAVLIEYD